MPWLKRLRAALAMPHPGISGSYRAAYQRAQLDTYFANIGPGAVGHMANALIVVIAGYSTHTLAPTALWVLALAALVFLRLKERDAFLAAGGVVDARSIHRRQLVIAAAAGSLWGLGLAWFGTGATDAQFVVLAVCGAGMMCGAIGTLRTVPKIAYAFLLPLTAGVLIMFVAFAMRPGSSVYGVSLICLLASYVNILFGTYRSAYLAFTNEMKSRIDAIDHAETVKLLLNQFEDHPGDWLWTIDREGRLVDVGAPFAEACGVAPELLQGLALIDLFDDTPERSTLARHVKVGGPFRDLTLVLTVDGEERFWTLSARPRFTLDQHAGMRGVATDVTDSRLAEARIAYMAHYDSLTGLPNRFLFNDRFAEALANPERPSVAAMCLDLDQFKRINDTLGHGVGDKLLKIIARRIESALNSGDLLARLGGDEFAVLCVGYDDPVDLETLANRIIQVTSAPIAIEGHGILTSASVGIAIRQDDQDTAQHLLKNADLALYASKDGGRNRFSFFDSSMDDAARQRREVEMGIREALRDGQLALHYQPLIAIDGGRTVAYEALMRWEHPERGPISPSLFIPIAEESGLIIQLGEWVIREAMREAARWADDVSVSINLSAVQVRSPSLIGTVVSSLASSGIDPGRVEFEITETVLMHDSHQCLNVLHKLREMGLRIALDDFGTGYSSLNYLRSFPFDKIKIDKCFIEDMETRDDCRAIVRSVIDVARSLGITTTAEGVENSRQLALLTEEGCTQAQGYLFSRAEPANHITDLRRKGAAPQVPTLGALSLSGRRGQASDSTAPRKGRKSA